MATAKKSDAKKSPAKESSAKAPSKKAAAKPNKSAKTVRSKSSGAVDKYTKPELREHIKQEVLQGENGGRPGQWSARKAQLVAHEYEAQGGGYKGARDETQQSLTHWGEEHWTTSDGKPAERADGMHRYLPEEAWKKLTPTEKRSTEKKKLAGDHQGKQFVGNTTPAKKARKTAQKG